MTNSVKKYYGVAKKKKIANMIVAVTATLSIILILFTVYGQNVGNFVVSVETQVRLSLSLSETEDFASASARLMAKGLVEQTHATLADIPDDISEYDGSHNDNEKKKYFAYTFYIKNTSSVIIDYDVQIVFNKATKGSDSALRVMVIKNDEREIYAKAKEWPEEDKGKPEDHIGPGINIETPYTTIPFMSSLLVMKHTNPNFVRNAVDKYTVVMWLEGWDRECTDAIKGGIMRLEMQFLARY